MHPCPLGPKRIWMINKNDDKQAYTQDFWAGIGPIYGKVSIKHVYRMGLDYMKETVLACDPKE